MARSDPADAVLDELVRMGGRRVDDYTVRGPSPLAEVALSEQSGHIWVHWVEGDGSGGAISELLDVAARVAPGAPVAGEATGAAWSAWERQPDLDEMGLEEAEEIYPNVEPDNRFFYVEP